MNYYSTKNSAPAYSFKEAIHYGLAPDGGLFVPVEFPKLNISSFLSYKQYPDFAQAFLSEFIIPELNNNELQTICQHAFNFPLPLKQVSTNLHALELFHGPTAAFKDVGAQFLAQVMSATQPKFTRQNILVATSGDTGSAVANAFYQNKKYNVFILFPLGQVSPRQQHLLTCYGHNIYPLAIKGTFDDCQKLVKQSFTDQTLAKTFPMASANSINIGRLLPQCVYYAKSSLDFYQLQQQKPSFIIPTGNLGNALACIWAKTLGFPIKKIIFANNSNGVLTDYFKAGEYQPHSSQSTLANAMDVGAPSNMERLLHQFPTITQLSDFAAAGTVDDAEIQQTIKIMFKKYNKLICPHSATAYALALRKELKEPVIVAETAHPGKFSDTIEPLVEQKIILPENLNKLLQQPSRFATLAPNAKELNAYFLSTIRKET